ncbi:ABC transporter ATP-binding protein [Amycolatopsis sp. NPDC051061]|uniref:ABC transporter ATP-binding protein n=1 Tax=Amycolatopsis sp. NPDC051061 TaxID=3155042 RepID=UPI003448F1D4
MTPPVVELSDVGRVYDSDPPVHALRDVNLRVSTGDYLAVVGASGSGKSSLLNILGLLDRPDSGTYLLDGVDTTRLDDGQRTALRGSKIGFVFQSFHLLPYRSAAENVAMAELYRRGDRTQRARRAEATLDRVGLAHRVGFRPDRLSGGERQRVAIARALLGEPALLLCDEPTGNLDRANTEAVLDLFDDLKEQGVTLIVITHDDDVSRRAERRISIEDGRLSEESG